MAIIEELAKKRSIKMAKVSATITEELKLKADELCKEYGVPLDEYLGMLIENSEVAKQHKKLMDERKKVEQENMKEVETSNTDVKTTQNSHN